MCRSKRSRIGLRVGARDTPRIAVRAGGGRPARRRTGGWAWAAALPADEFYQHVHEGIKLGASW